MITKSITVSKPAMIQNQGLARAIECANSYKSYLTLSNGEASVNAKSLLGFLALQLRVGMALDVTADGPDEIQALDALVSHLCE